MIRRSLSLLAVAALASPAFAATPPAAAPAAASPSRTAAAPPVEVTAPLRVLGVTPDRTCDELLKGFAKAGLKDERQLGKQVTLYSVTTPVGPNANFPAPLNRATQVRVICTADTPAKPLQVEFLLSTPPTEVASVRAALATTYGGPPATQSWTFPNGWRAAAWPRGEANTVVLYQRPSASKSRPAAEPGQTRGPASPAQIPPRAPAAKAAS